MLKVDHNFNEVLKKIEAYHEESWLQDRYISMLLAIKKRSWNNFELHSFELYDEKRLIAAEIGYTIGRTYTSLTGFTTKEKAYNHWGKLQLTLLAQYLQEQGYAFWNLGHACLQYKLDLGAKVYQRDEFLKRWFQAMPPKAL